MEVSGKKAVKKWKNRSQVGNHSWDIIMSFDSMYMWHCPGTGEHTKSGWNKLNYFSKTNSFLFWT